LILKMSLSVDGFVAGPDGELDWVFRSWDDEATAWTMKTLRDAGLHIMGSRTFRDMSAYWPKSTEPFAALMNEIPKVVFSMTRTTSPIGAGPDSGSRGLADAREAHASKLREEAGPAFESWANARVASGDLGDEIARLRREASKDIVAHGGAGFAQSLVARGLVDEYRLLVHPIALGRGLPLFSKAARPLDLRLLEAKRFAGGGVAHVYEPAASRRS
jgi:dihydrofolate reductase